MEDQNLWFETSHHHVSTHQDDNLECYEISYTHKLNFMLDNIYHIHILKCFEEVWFESVCVLTHG